MKMRELPNVNFSNIYCEGIQSKDTYIKLISNSIIVFVTLKHLILVSFCCSD